MGNDWIKYGVGLAVQAVQQGALDGGRGRGVGVGTGQAFGLGSSKAVQ